MVNMVILVGNVGSEPEVKTFENGGKKVSFSFATTEGFKDKQETEWHSVVINKTGLVDVVERYVHKGSKLYLEGRNKTREWTGKDGLKRKITEVICSEMTMLGDSAEKKEVKEKDIPSLADGLEDSIPWG